MADDPSAVLDADLSDWSDEEDEEDDTAAGAAEDGAGAAGAQPGATTTGDTTLAPGAAHPAAVLGAASALGGNVGLCHEANRAYALSIAARLQHRPAMTPAPDQPDRELGAAAAAPAPLAGGSTYIDRAPWLPGFTRPTHAVPRARADGSGAVFGGNAGMLGHYWSSFELSSLPLQQRGPCCTLHEATIVRETLWMLHGAETFVYERAPVSGGEAGGDGPRLTPRAGVQVSHLSPTAVARVLDKFAQAGGALLEVAAFVEWALAARSVVPEAYRAFAAQVAAFRKSLRERLTSLETSVFTLMMLAETLEADLKLAKCLARLVRQGVPYPPTAAVPNARRAATLLNVLYEAAIERECMSETTGGMAVLSVTLFAAAIKPLLTAVDLWLNKGILTDQHDEFPIVAGAGSSSKHARDFTTWDSAYTLREGEAKGDVPRFFEPVLDQILVAGKTVWLLNNISKRDSHHHHHEVSDSSIYDHVMHAITKAVELPLDPRILQHSEPPLAGPGGGGAVHALAVHEPGSPSTGGRAATTVSATSARRHLFPSEEDYLQHQAIADAFAWDQDTPPPAHTHVPAVPEQHGALVTPGTGAPRTPWKLAVSIFEALDEQVRRQYEEGSSHLLRELRDGHGWLEHMGIFQGVFLHKAGDQLHAVFCAIFDRIMNGDLWEDSAELTTLLHANLLATSWSHLRTRLKVHVGGAGAGADTPPAVEQGGGTAGPGSGPGPVALTLDAVDNIRFEYEVSWPMSLFMGPATQDSYSQVFTFVLRLKWAKWNLDGIRTKHLDQLARTRTMDSLLHRLHVFRMHLITSINAFSSYIMTRILHTLGIEYMDKLAKAADLDEVRRLNEWYLDTVKDRCMLTDRAKSVRWAFLKILEVAIEYRDLWNRLEATPVSSLERIAFAMEADFMQLEDRFVKSCKFVVTLLDSINRRGIFPHLALLYEMLVGFDKQPRIWQ